MRLWFRQSLRNTLWLLCHQRHIDHCSRLTYTVRLLMGRCTYCGNPECID